jgi:hypothetical protein
MQLDLLKLINNDEKQTPMRLDPHTQMKYAGLQHNTEYLLDPSPLFNKCGITTTLALIVFTSI